MGSGQSYEETFDERALPRAGEVLDERYRLDRLLGVGGMGAVFSATDVAHDLAVAIKVLLPDEAENLDSTRRFVREAKAVQALDSLHVAQVFGTGRLSNGLPYMVQELLDGESLDRMIRLRAPLPVEEAVDLMLQTCEGVASAHARGIIHRDLKPSNLHTTSGAEGRPIVKVLDFGIAKATGRLDPQTDGLSLTEASSTLGSPQYMSPEQLRCSKTVDARTDIWSLGCILHKLLTGRGAFEADNVGAQFAMIVSDPPSPLREHRPELPAELEAVVLCCLEKQLDHRYQDVGQLAEALLPFAAAGAEESVHRTRSILDEAGVSAPSLPRAPDSSASFVEAATIVDNARTRRWRKEETEATSRAWNTAAEPTPSRRTGLWLTAIVLLVAVGFGSWGAYHFGAGHAPPASSAAATVTETSSTTAPPPASASATSVASVRIKLVLEPSDATVWLDGARTPSNPITLPRSDRVYEIVVRAPGYLAERREVRALRDAELDIALSPDSPRKPPGKLPVAPAKPGGAAGTAKPSATPLVHPKGPWSDNL
ncbi:MAG: serine/threonine protein kinase [Deltaproteobacteria bacterium]|jgi:serine/threonine-protein kinase|nr:serine/threonine protein kinase [Deltaproteobacteria bacterium]MBW2537731.1 serine/threonine protein kinase [Deltaproteobacteria bacterium]